MNTVRIAVVVDVYTGFVLSAHVMGDDGSENTSHRAYVMADDGTEYTAHQLALSSRTSAAHTGDGNDADILPELEPFTDDDEDGTSNSLITISTSPPWGFIDEAMQRLLLVHGATRTQFW